ncbi:diguanylate cyclase [Pseudobacteroides cellulosolvens]|nr:AAA family ATPase [Pseudobacteroides cellulosolvens]
MRLFNRKKVIMDNGGYIMIHLTGYKINEEIFKSNISTIFRGTRVLDNCPVVIKLLNNEYPTEKELSLFKREFEIMEKLEGSGVVKAYSLEKYNNSLAIVMEDVGGDSISKGLRKFEMGLNDKLALSIKITQSLVQVHQKNIIHKDVNPSNFIWNIKTNEVKIIDFGLSTELTREASQFINLNILEGTLNYISPEQTGRINRPIDYRTDLYSLGITFYELFTGQLPFSGIDELELIYNHIAKKPAPPIEKNSEIPVLLSNIIMKLISKTVEERYQSAFGLLKDLEFCQENLNKKMSAANSFIPGQFDILDRFEIPHKLYGRENEIEMLINGFEKAAIGSSEFLLVKGYSGVGKSSLIHEIRKPITGKKGYFISGKFNQFEKNIPYFGITQAFRELIKQLLAQSQNSLDNWKQNLLDAMGNNGQVIIDIIPELEQIIGSQPQAIQLNPLEAQNRFQMTFRKFINVFASKEHPLVVFLDDLQWSDTSTLDLIKYILLSGNVKHVLFIGAYRDNEVQAGHHLLGFMEELKNSQQDLGKPFEEIYLKPLEFSSVKNLIADTFHSSIHETEPLTDIIFHKTKGNPFFINRILNSLYLQGTFKFMVEKGQWVYELEKVKAAEISDNVVDLLVKGLESLPEETMNILKLVACIGTQFDLNTVCLISKKTVREIGKNLWRAIEKEIILPLNNNYRFINAIKNDMSPTDLEMRFTFAHDRIRQAIYSLIQEEEKCQIHLSIGEFLRMFRETERADEIFDMVNHLNIGKNLIKGKNERIELADLNILAGNKAKKSTAFAVALNYFETSQSLLSEEEWSLMPQKLFGLLMEQAETALLSGDLLKADAICECLSGIATNNLEKGAISNIKVLILIFQGKLYESIDEIRKTLLIFNISLPENTDDIGEKTKEGVMKMQQFLARTPVEELVNLPVMSDPEKIMVMQLLFQVVPPALQVNPMLYILVSLMMFEQTLTFGTSPLSCKCFGDCGVIQGTMLGDYKTGYKLGEAAFALINKFKAESQKPPVYFIFTYLSHWCAHYKESLDYYIMSYRTGLETGDLMHATYAIAHKAHLLMWVGKNLTECKAETENTIAFLKQAKGVAPLLLAEIVYYVIGKFQNTENSGNFDFEEQDNNMMGIIDQSHNLVFMARFFQYNTYLNIIMDNFDEAEKWNVMAENIIFAAISDFPLPDHYLFQGLILANKWSKASDEVKLHIKDKLMDIKQRLNKWAENCPANFAHKYLLLSAEIAIIENESFDTIINIFMKTMDSIGSNDFIQFKALCYERYGKFWLDKGDEIIGKAYIRDAYYLYKRWGAHRKVVLMEKNYSQYFVTEENTFKGTRGKKGTISPTTHSSIDMTSILKSSQAISIEIKIEKLLKILIHTLIENAGAQRGCLLLKNEADGQFYIEAIQDVNTNYLKVMHSLLFSESKDLCLEIVQYVTRTRETLVIHDAYSDENWQNNLYITNNHIKSVLCMPVIYQNRLKGIVYLENNLSDNVFTSERLEILKILSSQASISIENAKLYENMEEKVKERTAQLNTANEKLRELSLHDPLTSLYNRRYAFEFTHDKITKFIKNKIMLKKKLEKRNSSIEENVIGVFLIDIDHFKEVNDTYGHLAGDNVLIALSQTLKKIIRNEDILVRWGGEEFLIILYNTKPEYLDKFSRKILDKIKGTPIKVSENATIYKTCSLGYLEMPLALSNPDLLNMEQMINISDYALYQAKENGRNCAAHFKIIKQIENEEEIRNYLVRLTKTTKLDEEYFKIEFINSSDRVPVAGLSSTKD